MKPRLILIIIGSLIISVFSAVLADIYLNLRVPVLGDFAGLQYSLNPGIAFGIVMPPLIQSAAILIALLVIGYLAFMKSHAALAQWGYGLIIGGGLANVVDRVRDGFVTDYFQVGTFPIFNVADSCVTIGVGLLLLDAILSMKRTAK